MYHKGMGWKRAWWDKRATCQIVQIKIHWANETAEQRRAAGRKMKQTGSWTQLTFYWSNQSGDWMRQTERVNSVVASALRHGHVARLYRPTRTSHFRALLTRACLLQVLASNSCLLVRTFHRAMLRIWLWRLIRISILSEKWNNWWKHFLIFNTRWRIRLSVGFLFDHLRQVGVGQTAILKSRLIFLDIESSVI